MELPELWIELIFLWNYSKARISKLEHTDLSIVLDIQYLTLLERILFLLVEFCNVELRLGATVGTAWMLAAAVECYFCRLELTGSLLVLYGPGML